MGTDTEEIVFEDSENYSGAGNAIGIREIALEQFRKCFVEGSKALNNTGVAMVDKRGTKKEVDIKAQREIFCNCVEMLQIILMPEIKSNEDFIKDRIAAFETKLKEYRMVYNTDSKDTEEKLKKNKVDIGTWNKYIDFVELKHGRAKVEIYKELLTALSFLLNEINYFGEASFTG